MTEKLAIAVAAMLALGALGTVYVLAQESNMQSQPSLSKTESSDMPAKPSTPTTMATDDSSSRLEQATFASGCFWCSEAVFDELKGVKSVVSGYSGGKLANPTYEQVSSGITGHAESIQITYDPSVISFAQLLEVFWRMHDPTTLNRQGNDSGTQYRSAIFYHNDKQRKLAEHYKQQLDKSGAFDSPIVTEISPFTNFYPAEKYHQDYFVQNPDQGYCSYVIRPKVEKFRQAFGNLIDPEKVPAAALQP